MTRKMIDRSRGVVTTYTTCGELIAAVLNGTSNRKAAFALLGANSPLQRMLKQQLLVVR
jgi:hypothetical protein